MGAAEQGIIFLISIWIVSSMYVAARPETLCDPTVQRYFGWCEQWDCKDNCSCTTNDECKQYCESSSCKNMECRSGMTCTQSLHSTKRKPRAIQVSAESPFATQDCSEGECDNLVATRPETSNSDIKYFAFQNCVDGKCKNISSHVEITKQFCGQCDHMECSGIHTLNCTQKCVVHHCRMMYCNAKQCEQVCSHGSQCEMYCGPQTKYCSQVCQLGSACRMACSAEHCHYNCTDATDCIIGKLPTERPNTYPTKMQPSSTPYTRSQKTTSDPGIDSNAVETDVPFDFKPVNNDISNKAEYDTLSLLNNSGYITRPAVIWTYFTIQILTLSIL